jgi:protein-S-isoprenylcysteine O-methyltransferase Ste14
MYVRHPAYLSYVLAVFSAPLILNSFVSLAFSLTFLLGLYVRIKKEEEVLMEHVRGYKTYKKETWHLLPGVW